MATAHNDAKVGDIAKTVLMPGDPLRAKFIANEFLEDVKQFNSVRGMLGFTGTYKGKRVSVMGHGMGIPSIGIYSYELYDHYGVDNIIRIGSCGALTTELKLYDVILATSCYSSSLYAKELGNFDEHIFDGDKELNDNLIESAKVLDIPLKQGRVVSGDAFYGQGNAKETLKKLNVIGAEMEFFGLCANAKKLNKKAACLLTVSDHLITHEMTTTEERQTSFTNMIKLALESVK